MPHLAALIILIPCTDGRVIPDGERHPDGLTGEVSGVSGELHQAWERRKRFLEHLAPHRDKVAVATRDRYVHAKLWIFDDTVAIIGSANINRRGYAHDSEGAIAFQDVLPAAEVRRLRIDLWHRHLGDAAPSSSTPAEQALRIWQTPPPNAKVVRYNPHAGTDKAPVPGGLSYAFKTRFWDTIVDPDCPGP